MSAELLQNAECGKRAFDRGAPSPFSVLFLGGTLCKTPTKCVEILWKECLTYQGAAPRKPVGPLKDDDVWLGHGGPLGHQKSLAGAKL